jgi:hypothetical protein
LQQKDYVKAALTLYDFLKQERLEAIPWQGIREKTPEGQPEPVQHLEQIEKEMAEFIEGIL